MKELLVLSKWQFTAVEILEWRVVTKMYKFE